MQNQSNLKNCHKKAFATHYYNYVHYMYIIQNIGSMSLILRIHNQGLAFVTMVSFILDKIKGYDAYIIKTTH